MSLESFKDIKPTTQPMSCGAAALAAALTELNIQAPTGNIRTKYITTTHLDLQKFEYDDSVQVMIPDKLGQELFIEYLYAGTGNLKIDFKDSTANYIYQQDALSSPSALVSVANYVSNQALEITVNLSNEAKKIFQNVQVQQRRSSLYETERELISTIYCQGEPMNINIDNLPYQRPNELAEFHLLLLGPSRSIFNPKPAPNHWVVVGHANCYDPADGKVTVYDVTPQGPYYELSFPSLPNKSFYTFYGLWISLKRKPSLVTF